MLFDTHCHIQFQAYKDDRDEVIKRNTQRGVVMNLVGTQTDTSTWAVELAAQHDNMYASIGTHPIHLFPTHVDEEETHFMSREEDFDEAHYETLVQSDKVIAIGETGIDLYHVPKDKTVEEVLAKQRDVFLNHVAFAKKHDLPLVVHCRDAHDELIQILDQADAQTDDKIRGTIHCYTSDWEHAQAYLGFGFHLGFTGVITFPPRKTDPEVQLDLIEVVKNMPEERILIETDAPYLAPQKYRGKRAEPYMCEEQVKMIAQLRGKSEEYIEQLVFENAKRLFGV